MVNLNEKKVCFAMIFVLPTYITPFYRQQQKIIKENLIEKKKKYKLNPSKKELEQYLNAYFKLYRIRNGFLN